MPKATPNKRFVEDIPVKLTPEELIMKGRELARLGLEIAKKEGEKKLAASAIKGEIDELQEQRDDLNKQLNTGEEERPIECYERPRYRDLIVDVIRTDTGDVWRQRPMHPDERQLAINTGELEVVAPEIAQGVKSKKKKPDPVEESSESAH